MKTILFKPKYYGIAAENLDISSNNRTKGFELQVWPLELTPSMSGDITPSTIDLTTKGLDENLSEYASKVKLGFTIKSHWLGNGNHLLPANIRRGAEVLLYQVGDSDTYYWKEIGTDLNLRRLETILIGINSNPNNEDSDVFNLENYYLLELSTHKNLINFTTTQNNGESCSYVFQLDTGKGRFTIKDNVGNHIHHDSMTRLFEYLNKDQSNIKIDKKNILVDVKDSISLNATNNINLTSKQLVVNASDSISMTTKSTTLNSSSNVNISTGDFKLDAGSGTSITTGDFKVETGGCNIKSGSTTIKAGSFNVDSGAVMIKGSAITLDGMVTTTMPATVGGPLTVAGPALVGGIAAAGGAMKMPSGGGPLAMKDDIKIKNVSIFNHTHTAIASGPGAPVAFSGPIV